MLNFKNSFKDIEGLIEHLKKKEQVVGIVEYGGRTLEKSFAGYPMKYAFPRSITLRLIAHG